ncbi:MULTISPECIES: APC family permease [Streptomyces]|uniref:APC family permease n=1 Tax=Streptomyces TaxID=1883 RepID=UPI0013168D9B|nr:MULTISPECIES: amino acid permease [Streptomyces]QGZ51142.1 amino acid permease [Streptomyces sp. QHH-9511]GGU00491.1 amino acid permease [Streptomyces lateritius]
MSEVKTESSGGRLTAVQGTAMYVGAVLGTGVIALPALAAEAAGPASLLAWLALVLLSAPLAFTFAALGARYPDAGGVATYAMKAFGERASAVVGWCFYLAVPPGAAAAALFGGAYVSAALGGGTTTTTVTAIGLMVVVTAANALGLRVTGKLQFMLAGLLVTLLLVAVALSLPKADTANLEPFAPHGWMAIGPAAALLVWSFAGWEAITHLAGEFRHPARDLPRAAAAAVVIVGGLYLLVAFAVVTVLGDDAAASSAPLGELMARGLGGDARFLAAGAALLLTMGAMNAYYAGAANLGAALGRDGALPGWFARGSVAGEVPRRSLALVSALSFLALFVVVSTGLGIESLVLLTTGSFVAVYAIGVAAAVRLLPKGTKGRVSALLALVAVVALLIMAGFYLLWPLAVAGAALLYLRLNRRRHPRDEQPDAAPEPSLETAGDGPGAS